MRGNHYLHQFRSSFDIRTQLRLTWPPTLLKILFTSLVKAVERTVKGGFYVSCLVEIYRRRNINNVSFVTTATFDCC